MTAFIPNVVQVSKPMWSVDGVNYEREIDAHRAAFTGYVAALLGGFPNEDIRVGNAADILADNHEALFRVLGNYVQASRKAGRGK